MSTPPPKPVGSPMTGAELTQIYLSGTPLLISGHSLKSGRNFTIARDGKGGQSITNPSNDFSDTGTYRIQGNQLCSKWVKIREGAESCNSVFKAKDGSYEYSDEKGNLAGTFTLSKPS